MSNIIFLIFVIFAIIGMYTVYPLLVKKKKCMADCFESASLCDLLSPKKEDV